MSTVRGALLEWIRSIAAAVVTDETDVAEIADRLEKADDLDAAGFARETIELTRIVAENARTVADFEALIVPAGVDVAAVPALFVLQAVALSISGARVLWPARPAARSARGRIAVAADAAAAVASSMGGGGADLFAWLSQLTQTAIRLVSDRAATTAPIVRIQTGVSLPSTVLAYQLYGDASRAAGLVDIAGSMTPLVMPSTFDAIAPEFSNG